MVHPTSSRTRPDNALLNVLSDAEFAAIADKLGPIRCAAKTVVGVRGDTAKSIIFPCGAVLSVLAYMQNGMVVEIGTIGREGFHGIEVLLDGTAWAETTICQVSGDAVQMSVADFQHAIHGDSTLRHAAARFLSVYLALVSQSVACNRLHNIEERFARWILMTHDRVGADSFNLTQEFIADMLGVHRPQVSVVAKAFQLAGHIDYKRGRMKIRNRAGIEAAACECYQIGRAQIAEMLAPLH